MDRRTEDPTVWIVTVYGVEEVKGYYSDPMEQTFYVVGGTLDNAIKVARERTRLAPWHSSRLLSELNPTEVEEIKEGVAEFEPE